MSEDKTSELTLALLFGDRVVNHTYKMQGELKIGDETKFPALDAWKALSLGG